MHKDFDEFLKLLNRHKEKFVRKAEMAGKKEIRIK